MKYLLIHYNYEKINLLIYDKIFFTEDTIIQLYKKIKEFHYN